ncbi:MAG: DUF1330 domain-containing protein [Myxococcota bacterium]|nr:DUF1330 domain-containing protein [Myxococcota bacterium]
MKVENAVTPEREQVMEFIGGEGRIAMVNLLKFKEKAEYPDGRDADISGKEAYGRYAQEMNKLLEANGGGITFMGRVENLLLGEVGELWDVVAIAEYPSPQSLITIASSPEFQAIEVHRLAGLAGQLNITTTPGEEAEFG